ncbi:MAG: HAD-IIB family hydrolase [Candidatus Kaiserbacteria bacterium]|nr:HAD-IIB family hydrolase [Candidatus Kaiserbacteria bacterium]
MECPKAVIFDLDDTLAESFRPPRDDMVTRLSRLLEAMPVAIMSAAGFPRIEADFLHKMTNSPRIDSFYIFPNSSAQCFTHEAGSWQKAYSFQLTDEERAKVRNALAESVAEVSLEFHPHYLPAIVDRDVQIAYAALGLEASEADKKAWDPDQRKRKKLKESLEKKLPDFEVLIGGKTTIDITHKGVNKAYGVTWLATRLGLPTIEMLYVGDAFYEGGNDAVVIPTGIQTRSVTGPPETLTAIDEILATCAAN